MPLEEEEEKEEGYKAFIYQAIIKFEFQESFWVLNGSFGF